MDMLIDFMCIAVAWYGGWTWRGSVERSRQEQRENR